VGTTMYVGLDVTRRRVGDDFFVMSRRRRVKLDGAVHAVLDNTLAVDLFDWNRFSGVLWILGHRHSPRSSHSERCSVVAVGRGIGR